MGVSPDWYREYEAKRLKSKLPAAPATAVAREIPLHDEIIKWCEAQWPRVKYIRARSDRESTIAEGCHDFTLFLPKGRTLCFEVKAKDGKVKTAQASWMAEMKSLEHQVFIVRSMEDFHALIST